MEHNETAASLTLAAMGIEPGRALEASTGGVEELRRDIQTLMDIEAIRRLKHAYFRCVDTANLEELAGLLHEDVTVHFVGGSYEWSLRGRNAFVEAIGQAFHRRTIGQHNGHTPEIQILGESEATGIWYLADHMWQLDSGAHTRGTALYHDRYLKVDGRWLILESRYRRIYEFTTGLEPIPEPTAHYLGRHGGPPPGADG